MPAYFTSNQNTVTTWGHDNWYQSMPQLVL